MVSLGQDWGKDNITVRVVIKFKVRVRETIMEKHYPKP